MRKPQVKEGKLSLTSFAELSKAEIKAWLSDYLRGQNNEFIGDPKDPNLSYDLMAHIYPGLDRDSQRYIRESIQEFLHDMSRVAESDWRGNAAHELLLVAQEIGEGGYIGPILRMVHNFAFFDERGEDMSEDLYGRLLQSLIYMEWKGDAEFWTHRYRLDKERFADLAFDGLANIALDHAIGLLPEVPWENQDVKYRMFMCLRGLRKSYKDDQICDCLIRLRRKMTDRVLSIVLSMLPEIEELMSLRVPDPVPVKASYQRAKEFFEKRGFTVERQIARLYSVRGQDDVN
jgi:hypothetical protein